MELQAVVSLVWVLGTELRSSGVEMIFATKTFQKCLWVGLYNLYFMQKKMENGDVSRRIKPWPKKESKYKIKQIRVMVHHDSLRICIKHSLNIYIDIFKIFNDKDIENYFTKYKKYFAAHLLRHLTFRLTLCFQKFLVVSHFLCVSGMKWEAIWNLYIYGLSL